MWWFWLPLTGVGALIVAGFYLMQRYGRPLEGDWPPG
jgi:hypothetical protein